MEGIILAAVPVIVNIIMQFIKRIPEFSELKEGNRKTALRVSAYILSVVAMYLSQYTSDEIDLTAIESMVAGAVTFLMSQGLYHLKSPTQK